MTSADATARFPGEEAATGAEATTGISGVATVLCACVPARRAASAATITATPANIQTARSTLPSPPRSTMAEAGNMDVVAGAGTEGGKDDRAGRERAAGTYAGWLPVEGLKLGVRGARGIWTSRA